MERQEILGHMKEFLNSHFQMTIGTYASFPWTATVYYSVDQDMNIYFLSNPETLHCKQLEKNPKVSVAVVDSPQKSSSLKKGIQIYGKAKRISGANKIRYALDLWKKTLDVTSPLYTYEGMMKKAIKGRMYKVTPIKIKFFNEALWVEGTEPVIKL